MKVNIDVSKLVSIPLMIWLGATGRVDWWVLTIIVLYACEAMYSVERRR